MFLSLSITAFGSFILHHLISLNNSPVQLSYRDWHTLYEYCTPTNSYNNIADSNLELR